MLGRAKLLSLCLLIGMIQVEHMMGFQIIYERALGLLYQLKKLDSKTELWVIDDGTAHRWSLWASIILAGQTTVGYKAFRGLMGDIE